MGQSFFNAHLKKHAMPFGSIDDFGALIETYKDKKIVMIGESSHGTHEFYEWRARISKELIEKHGFNFIAVEGDWPACHQVHQRIQNRSKENPLRTLSHFSRWPTWMWGNLEMADVIKWLSEWNDQGHSVGFHGLDVYSLYESIEQVKKSVKNKKPQILEAVQEFYSCFDPYLHNEKAYAKSLFQYPEGCADEVSFALEEILKSNIQNDEAFFDAVQNAKIIRNAEKYYRTMITGEDSWNVRDHHMMETLERLMEFYGSEARGIVWAHNTHVGDYRATDMLLANQINIGGLARERFGEKNVALIGFSTYSGSVVAGAAWDGKIEIMKVPEGAPGSLEHYLHSATNFIGAKQFYIEMKKVKDVEIFHDFIGHRAIGVVYHPAYESRGNYVPTIAAKRYDALIFIDKTSALSPLEIHFDREKIPETYPFGAHM
jgi:erythromycin esterase-like protein